APATDPLTARGAAHRGGARQVAARGRHAVVKASFAASLLRRILIALVLVKVVGIVVLFTWNGQFGFDIVKALWSRAIEWPTAAALLLTLYRYGLAVIPRTRLHFLVVGFVVANFLSVLTAENHYISIFGERNRYLGFTNTV